MKRCMIFAVALLIAAPAFAVLLPVGTSELSLSGNLDFETADGTTVNLSTFYGYFFQDSIEAGVAFRMLHNRDLDAWALGVKSEYNFDLGTELAPYVGAGLGYGVLDARDGGDDKKAVIMTMEAGVKYFVTEYLALSGALVMDLATDDLYPRGDTYDTHDERIELGIRVFF